MSQPFPNPSLSRPSRRTLFTAGLALASSAVLVACGGGGDTSTAPSTGSTSQASSYAQGPITGFGSVFVGGVRYDDSAAAVEDDDGNTMSRSMLKLGMVVEVDAGRIDRLASTALALRIRWSSEVVGPVGTVDPLASTVQVLGQTVLVTSSTLFDETLMGGLSALTPGTVVEVYGLLDPSNGRIVATRIEAEDSASAYKVRGQITNLDSTAKTFTINGLPISYTNLPGGLVPPGLVNGQYVRVRLQTTQVAGAWVATGIRGGLRVPQADRDSHVEGIVTSFTSTSTFQVNGLAVDASNARFPDGTDGVRLGARVEVEGVVVNGVIVASKVEIEERRIPGPRQWELRGEVGRLNTTDKTFALRGLTVWYGGTVDYRDGSETRLSNGARVEVKGVLAADRTRLEAKRIEFK
ncbi:MAG: DUF5666 domain-containing protein [Rubrivivax sp.]|nr:DUF5666 domain-containing protein [Rubrivivax sp.]